MVILLIVRSLFRIDLICLFPELQFVGDRACLMSLMLLILVLLVLPFGYQYRDMQYKLFYSVADGGFIENLPGYGFIFQA